jgi:hypothetical protein
MKTQICFGIIFILLVGCGHQSTRHSHFSAANLEIFSSQDTPSPTPPPTRQLQVTGSPPPQVVSMPVTQPAVKQPNLAATSSEVQEVLLQYPPDQITNIASQITSHPLCSANAVQTYYAGSLDYCKAYQVLTDAQIQRSAAFTNQYGNQNNSIQTENYQRQSIQTDQERYQDAKRRSFAPGN